MGLPALVVMAIALLPVGGFGALTYWKLEGIDYCMSIGDDGMARIVARGGPANDQLLTDVGTHWSWSDMDVVCEYAWDGGAAAVVP